MIFRLRFIQKGGHVHCRLFQATAAGHTWQKNGDLVFDEPGWRSFQSVIWKRVELLPEEDDQDDRRELAAMYDRMSVAELALLQTALRLDREHAKSPETRAFCDDRLFLITAAVRARGTPKLAGDDHDAAVQSVTTLAPNHPDCVCRHPHCGHKASEHVGPGGACLVDMCPCGPGGWT